MLFAPVPESTTTADRFELIPESGGARRRPARTAHALRPRYPARQTPVPLTAFPSTDRATEVLMNALLRSPSVTAQHLRIAIRRHACCRCTSSC